ncbi:MAG TPA: LacI family DNA-binding transcriptional regulator [Thermoanaerobaculia bacterium]|nr:LacI family DNA-binding transcriptional regulator [Thermoanaerobaculia bacterium]
MAITIKEVAREAGVSVATVSRVFTGKGPVQEETRRRVLEVAARLRYLPNATARSLTTNKTGALGVLLPDLYGEFFSEVIRGIDLAARRRGYHVFVSSSHSDRSEVETVLRALRGRVDGLLVMSPEVDAQALQANLPAALPVTLLNTEWEGSDVPSLNIDNHGGAYAMARHLVGLGHRRIAFVEGAPGNYDARERLRGYRDGLRDSVDPAVGAAEIASLEIPGEFSEESGYRAGAALLRLDPRPTAVFAANDAMAIGLLSALQEAGVRVPADIAVAGFDDIPIARFLTPALTTVRVGIAELGARALERLLAAVENPEDDANGPPGGERRHEVLPVHLVVRGSCGAQAQPPAAEEIPEGNLMESLHPRRWVR